MFSGFTGLARNSPLDLCGTNCQGPGNGDVASTSETSVILTGSNSPTTGSSDPAGGSSPTGEDSTPVVVMSEAYKTQAAGHGEASASLVRPGILGSIGLSSSGEESVAGHSISIIGASLTTSAMSLTSLNTGKDIPSAR